MQVSNHTNIAQHYYLLTFTDEYLYKEGKLGTILIGKLTSSNKPRSDKMMYAKPYEDVPYLLDSNAFKYIFPDIEGEVFRFSSNFRKLQIREFSFDKLK